MKIHGMVLVRNEMSGDRWLSDFIDILKLLCDRIVILDDKSNDGTYDFCIKCSKNVDFETYQNQACLWETNELKARSKLWDLTIKKADDEDWILCLDADELFCFNHISYIEWTFNLLSKIDVDSIGFRLFDMWDKKHYRSDKWWTAHCRFWPMAVKYFVGKKYIWSNKKLHCGRFPLNAASKMFPTNIPIQHLGWSTKKFRKLKYDRYMRIDPNGKEGILEQYKSILDKKVNLVEF